MLKKLLFVLFLTISLLGLLSCSDSKEDEEPQIPSITSLSPSAGMTNSPDFPIVVSGQNFTSDCVVIFNDVQVTTTYVNATTLNATITNALAKQAMVSPAKSGTPLQDKQVYVKVQNSAGTSEQRTFTFYDSWNFPGLSNINTGEAVMGLDISMAQNADGHLYAVWTHLAYTESGKLGANITGSEIRFSRSVDGGTSWTAPQAINGSLTIGAFDYPAPQIMIGANNTLYTFFSRSDPALYYSFFWMTMSTDNGSTWSEPVVVNPTTSTYIPKAELYPSFYLEPLSKNMYSTWSSMTYGYKYAIYFSRSIAQANISENDLNSSFSEPIRISDYTNVMQGSSEVSANNLGNVSAVWFQPVFNSYYIKELWTASSNDWGKLFSSPQCIADRTQINQIYPMPDLTVDPQGNIFIVYVSPFNGTASEIMMQKSTDHGATFSSPIKLTNGYGTCLTPFITSDSVGNLTVIYQIVSNNTAYICSMRSTNGGDLFTTSNTLGIVNLPPAYNTVSKKQPNVGADFYPRYAPIGRVLMTTLNRPLIAVGNFYSLINYLDTSDSFVLNTLQFTLGTGER